MLRYLAAVQRDMRRHSGERVRGLAGLVQCVCERYDVRRGRTGMPRDTREVLFIVDALDGVLGRPDDAAAHDAARRAMRRYLDGRT